MDENTKITVETLDKVIKILAFCDTHIVSGGRFKNVYTEDEVDEVIKLLLNVRHRILPK